MPGFVKTSTDESRWSRAKKLASKYSGKTLYKVANTIYHNIKHHEGKDNPGKMIPTKQFEGSGKPGVFGSIPKRWQGDYDSTWTGDPASQKYDHGARKPESRVVGIGPGGKGKVIPRTRDSSLGKRG